MKRPKLIAIAFSDPHINLWTKFNEGKERTQNHFRVLSFISKQAIKNNVPVICGGDLFHKPENIDSELFDITTKEFMKLGKTNWRCYSISGNHDMKSNNTINKPSPSFVKSFSKTHKWLTCIDHTSIDLNLFKLHGIPYLDHNLGLNDEVTRISKTELDKNKPNILVLHTDYPGAKDTDGTKVDSVENLNVNLLNPFDLVIIGHIHKPQRLSKKVYMIGATHQQRRTDKDCELGYWEIYSDMTMKFKSLTNKFPRFIDVEDESQIKDDGNYYTVIPKKLEKKEVTSNIISPNLSKAKLARKYMREIGMKDKLKSKLLISLLKEAQDD